MQSVIVFFMAWGLGLIIFIAQNYLCHGGRIPLLNHCVTDVRFDIKFESIYEEEIPQLPLQIGSPEKHEHSIQKHEGS
jgi:hypothetical protein